MLGLVIGLSTSLHISPRILNSMHTENKNPDFIPFALPYVGEEEIDAVVKTMRSGWLTTGPKTNEFETKFADFVGSKYALAVNSATSGLHLALDSIGVTRDDYVIVPTWTFTSTAEVVRYLGANPIFIDVDAKTLNIDVGLLEEEVIKVRSKYGSKLKAIIPVHFAGRACEMNAIVEIAQKYGLYIVEDAAHALPTTVKCKSITDSTCKSRVVGTIGHITVFSFYATKTITTGEGGMITTNDKKLLERMRVMRLHGINKDVWDRYTSNKPAWYYNVVAAGYKYNLTDIASAIGICQLNKIDWLRKRRKKIATYYNNNFINESSLQIPAKEHDGEIHSWHLYVLRLNIEVAGIDRDNLIEELTANGVGCSVHFIPLHMQTYWKKLYELSESDFPVASREFKRCLSLPIYPSMTDEQARRVTKKVAYALNINSGQT